MTPSAPAPAPGSLPNSAAGTPPAITSAELYEWLAHRRRTQRRLMVVAVALIAVVASVLTAYFMAFSRHLIAMNYFRSNGFRVEWEIDWSNARTGGTTSITFQVNRWSMNQQVDTIDLNTLKSLNHVESLDLSDLIRLRDDDLDVVAALVDLQDLELNRTSETGMERLMRTPGVGGQPGMPGVLLSDRVLDHVQGLTRLKALGLAGNRITDAGLAKLANLQALEILDLDGTGVTNAGLEALVGLKSLKILRVENTRVTKRGVARFQQKRPDVEVTHQLEFDENGTPLR